MLRPRSIRPTTATNDRSHTVDTCDETFDRNRRQPARTRKFSINGPQGMTTIAFNDVAAAAARLNGHAHRTEVLTSGTLNDLLQCQVYLKNETQQKMGAFKFRGGFNAIASLTPDQRAKGVVTFSSGNHAQAIALASKLHNIPAVIVMPSDAPAIKVAATKGYGGEVVLYDRFKEDRAAIAAHIAKTRGCTLIPPFDDFNVMAGQGTVAMELLEDVPNLDVLIACAGGGGLLSGCAVAAKHLNPNIKVYGAEPEAGDDMRRSLHSGQIVKIAVPLTICDGQQTQAVGAKPFQVIKQLVTDILTVPDSVVVEAMRFAFERMKIVLEPSGACALAALMHHRSAFVGKRVGVTLSGGNIDVARFVAIMTGAERYDDAKTTTTN